MPYIKSSRREEIALDMFEGFNSNGSEVWSTTHIDFTQIKTPGELNYAITEIILDYADNHPGYQGINDVLGALEGAKLEFYRRYVAKYEDEKIQENGDVY